MDLGDTIKFTEAVSGVVAQLYLYWGVKILVRVLLTDSESHLLRVDPLGHELALDERPDLGLLAGEPGHPLAGLVEAEVAHDEGRRDLGVVEIHS